MEEAVVTRKEKKIKEDIQPKEESIGLKNLFEYPLMSALQERRTRRVCKGANINSGGISYESPNKPESISRLEEAILVVSTTGITGITMHDGPTFKVDGKELGTPFLHLLARTASSADNCQATSFFMINDEGNWLIKQPKGEDALELMANLPPKWKDWTENDWISTAEKLKQKISDTRVDFPRHFPYYLGWNAQGSNLPGTTIFFPVVDCTRQYINAIMIVMEPDKTRPLIIDDWRKFTPKTLMDWAAWIGMKLNIVENIPYHPVGGIESVRSGFFNKNNIAPLGLSNTLRTDYGSFFQFQNLMLIAQGMGLGGWIHGSIFPPYVFEDKPELDLHGLGFRMEKPKKEWSRWSTSPPLPSTQPNPVGIDGILEGLCPPYVSSMDEAVDIVIEEKYSAKHGYSYGNKDLFNRSYKKPEYGDEYLKNATRMSPEIIKHTKDVCNYIYDTYGRFPAHVDAFYCPGVWLQVQNLEIEYYEKFYNPDLYERQAKHDELWGIKK